MSNRGLKSIDQNLCITLNEQVTTYVNLKKIDANIIINFPIISTFGIDKYSLTLYFNYLDIQSTYNTYGKGVKLSNYIKLQEINSQLVITWYDGCIEYYTYNSLTRNFLNTSQDKYITINDNAYELHFISSDDYYVFSSSNYNLSKYVNSDGIETIFTNNTISIFNNTITINETNKTFTIINGDYAIYTCINLTDNGYISNIITTMTFNEESKIISNISFNYNIVGNDIHNFSITDNIFSKSLIFNINNNEINNIYVKYGSENSILLYNITYYASYTYVLDRYNNKSAYYHNGNRNYYIDHNFNTIKYITENDKIVKKDSFNLRYLFDYYGIKIVPEGYDYHQPTNYYPRFFGVIKEYVMISPFSRQLNNIITYGTKGAYSFYFIGEIHGSITFTFIIDSEVFETKLFNGTGSYELYQESLEINECFNSLSINVSYNPGSASLISDMLIVKKNDIRDYTYNSGKLISVEDNEGTCIYTYNGNKISSINKNGIITNYTYNENGKISSITSNVINTTYFYDENNKLIEEISYNNDLKMRIKYAYQNNSLASSIDYCNNEISYQYDSLKRISRILNSGEIEHNLYELNELISKYKIKNEGPFEYLEYEYNNRNIRSIKSNNRIASNIVTISYNYEYDSHHNITKVYQNDELLEEYGYENDLLSFVHILGTNLSINITYLNSQIQNIELSDGYNTRSINYSYNYLGKISCISTFNEEILFSYDFSGNLINKDCIKYIRNNGTIRQIISDNYIICSDSLDENNYEFKASYFKNNNCDISIPLTGSLEGTISPLSYYGDNNGFIYDNYYNRYVLDTSILKAKYKCDFSNSFSISFDFKKKSNIRRMSHLFYIKNNVEIHNNISICFVNSYLHIRLFNDSGSTTLFVNTNHRITDSSWHKINLRFKKFEYEYEDDDTYIVNLFELKIDNNGYTAEFSDRDFYNPIISIGCDNNYEYDFDGYITNISISNSYINNTSPIICKKEANNDLKLINHENVYYDSYNVISKDYSYISYLDTTTYIKPLISNEIIRYGNHSETINYTYNYNNLVTSITNGNEVTNYVYDDNGYLLSDNYYSYSYDKNGNVLSITGQETYNLVYDTDNSGLYGNKLLIVNNHNVLYYENTLLIEELDDLYYTYELGKIKTVTKNNITYTYYYDLLGRRIKKEYGNTIINYYYKDNKIISEKEYLNNNLIICIDYIYDIDDNIYGFIYNDNTYFYIKDILGNINKIISSGGIIVGEYKYSGYGKIKYINGSIANINKIRYKSYYYDTESELYYLYSRYYNPSICRFMSIDNVN